MEQILTYAISSYHTGFKDTFYTDRTDSFRLMKITLIQPTIYIIPYSITES